MCFFFPYVWIIVSIHFPEMEVPQNSDSSCAEGLDLERILQSTAMKIQFYCKF